MSTLPDGYSLRLAAESEFSSIRAFYDRLIDDLAQLPHHPMWDKEGHPSDAYIRSALAGGELWVAETGACEVAGALILNHAANDGYKQVPWRVQAEPQQVAIVHAFGVATSHQGRGLGSAMMHHVIRLCREAGDKAIRLDLIDLNRPTEKVYFKLGFTKCAEIELYYEEVGWQLFHMFELAL